VVTWYANVATLGTKHTDLEIEKRRLVVGLTAKMCKRLGPAVIHRHVLRRWVGVMQKPTENLSSFKLNMHNYSPHSINKQI
jgi:hypothetical protein